MCGDSCLGDFHCLRAEPVDAKIALKAFLFSGLTPPSPVAGARRGLRGAAAPAFRTQTQGRHFALPRDAPTRPRPSPLSRQCACAGGGAVCARARPRRYIRVGAAGVGGAALQTDNEAVIMARPLILGLLSLLGLLAAAVASPVLWQKECVKGPEVWCQSIRTASQCGAVKHCQQNVWNKPAVSSIPCDLCKELVTVAGKVLKDNGTEDEIRSYLEKTCEFLPDPGLVSECKEIVDSYLPVIMDMIKEELDKPEVVCSALALCQSLQKHLAAMKLQKQLQTNKIPELDFSELASPFMANVPLLLYPQDKPKQKLKASGDVCQDCIQLVTDVQEAVKTNSSFVKSLVAHAKEECDRLGPGMSDMCKTYISEYSDLAIQMMMHMKDQNVMFLAALKKQPKDICAMVGFCSSVKSVPLQPLLPAHVVHEVKMETVEKAVVQEKTFSLCEICETMVKEVTGLLESNKTEEEIVHEMEVVCRLFPGSVKDQCKDFIEVYGQAVIDMLLEATNPEAVCAMLKCCAAGKLPQQPVVVKSAGGFCDICKMVVAYADKELEKNATTAEIEALLEKVCHFLPESVSDQVRLSSVSASAINVQCVQFVEQYEPVVVQLLAEVMDPTFVCTKLGVCESTKEPLLGNDACVWGPGYWCKNMDTAAQCNAVDHCKRHVWN
ncbi:prosaposin isoform X3 [Corvus kubaryi]|uniref:prosaposin isoform X3 n=1 Tax=Corvus kubaryi TaxID=68294 RepID=UPI001C047448|nr:prosaposin isoform X3 [Corvus kubaryi]